jgi:hypothetical protein
LVQDLDIENFGRMLLFTGGGRLYDESNEKFTESQELVLIGYYIFESIITKNWIWKEAESRLVLIIVEDVEFEAEKRIFVLRLSRK